MAINLQALRMFTVVADRGGFTRAAAVLRVSQPAVSKAVAQLEREVGMPLLERRARTVQLTEVGATLLERAHELFAVERTAEEELRALSGLQRGVLRVGASTTIATYLLPSLLGTFSDAHPGVALRVTSGNTRAVARLLARRAVDVALVEGPVSDARMHAEPWRDDELVIIAAPEHPLAARVRSVSMATLATYPFVSRERGSGTREVAEAAFAAAGFTPTIVLTLDSTEAVKQAVAAGLGLAVVSRATASDQLALGRVCEVRAAGLLFPRQLTILRLIGRRISAPAAAFESLLLADRTSA